MKTLTYTIVLLIFYIVNAHADNPKHMEILKNAMATDGQVTVEMYNGLREAIREEGYKQRKEYPPQHIIDLIIKTLRNTLSDAQESQKEFWESVLLTYENKKIIKTERFITLQENASSIFAASTPFEKGSSSQQKAIEYFEIGRKRGEAHQLLIFEAVSKHQPSITIDNVNVDLSKEALSKVLRGIKYGFQRLDILTADKWDEKRAFVTNAMTEINNMKFFSLIFLGHPEAEQKIITGLEGISPKMDEKELANAVKALVVKETGDYFLESLTKASNQSVYDYLKWMATQADKHKSQPHLCIQYGKGQIDSNAMTEQELDDLIALKTLIVGSALDHPVNFTKLTKGQLTTYLVDGYRKKGFDISNLEKVKQLSKLGDEEGCTVFKQYLDVILDYGLDQSAVIYKNVTAGVNQNFSSDDVVAELKKYDFYYELIRIYPDVELKIKLALDKISPQSSMQMKETVALELQQIINEYYYIRLQYASPQALYDLIKWNLNVMEQLQVSTPRLCVDYFLGKPILNNSPLLKEILPTESRLKAKVILSSINTPDSASETSVDELLLKLKNLYRKNGSNPEDLVKISTIENLSDIEGCKLSIDFTKNILTLNPLELSKIIKTFVITQKNENELLGNSTQGYIGASQPSIQKPLSEREILLKKQQQLEDQRKSYEKSENGK